MTQSQVSEVLTETSNSFGMWVTLEDSFRYFILESDRIFFCDAQAVQFFFSESGYVLLRYTDGRPIAFEGGSVPAGYALVVHDGDQYIIRIKPGGAVDQSADEAGVYHEIIGYQAISGFFQQK